MSQYRTLIDELEGSVAHRDIGHRADVLRRVTDLFVASSSKLTSEQAALFDNVMTRLVEEIDETSRVAFSQRIAGVETASLGVVRALAFDDSIEVAGPVLARFERMDDGLLVENASTKGQDHLFAISQRASLSEAVTDVLVDRGNRRVAISTAENPGAKFSEFGYSTLVTRADGDRDLTLRVWSRPEVPRQYLLVLFEAASEVVRKELQAGNPGRADEIHDAVARAKDELQTRTRERSANYLAVRSYVESLHQSGELSEARLAELAGAGRFDETSVALSLLCAVPIGLVERAMAHDKCDQLIVLTRSIELSWDTVKAILLLQVDPSNKAAPDIRQASISFNKLQPETARKAVQYYRLRERAGSG